MRKIPFHVLVMIVVTGLYLSAEVPFAVYLLHIMGGQSSPEDIHTVERFGRVLTGVAVFIAVLGGWLVPHFVIYRPRFIKMTFLTVVTGALTIGAVFEALNFYGSVSADFASVQSLRNAYVGTLARGAVAERGIGDLQPRTGDNAWNAFVATAAATSDVPSLLKATGLSTNELVSSEAIKAVGTANALRDRLFGDNFNDIRRVYNQYVDGSNAYTEAMRNVERDGAREWNAYMTDLHNRFPQGIPLRGWTTASIRNKVIARLPEISPDWNIVDRNGFMAAYRHQAEKEIRQRYVNKVQDVMGSGRFLRPGLSFSSFLSDANVQNQVRETVRLNLGIDVGNTVITPDMSPAAFEAVVYQPSLKHAYQKMMGIAATNQPIVGDDLNVAKDAYKAATLPATALLLSLAGAALHVFKVSSYIAQAFGFMTGSIPLMFGRRRFAVGGSVLAAGLIAMLMIGDDVTRTTAYKQVSNDSVYALVVKNAVAIQPSFERFASTLSTTGVWSLISSDLPAPVPYKIAVAQKFPAIDVTTTAAISSDIPANVPLPVTRPDV